MPNNLYPDLPLTNFPSNIDTFTTWLNIVASDGVLIQQYQDAIQAGNTTLANQILTQIPQVTQKIITATDLNKLSQAMLAIERFYLTDIEPYIETQQQSWLTAIQQFSYKGVWQNGTSYVVNNMVSYTVSGLNLIYIATSTPPVGTAPTNTQYWRVLTIQGQPGSSGDGLSYRQEWNSSTTYSTNDAATYDGAVWMALQSSQNRLPDSSPQYWRLIMNLETVAYPIQDTVPTNLQVDGLWFNTSDNPTQYIYQGDVDDGKSLIATAITDKGVATEATDSFAQMAANIGAIETSNNEGVTITITGSGNIYYTDVDNVYHENISVSNNTISILKNSIFYIKVLSTSNTANTDEENAVIFGNWTKNFVAVALNDYAVAIDNEDPPIEP